MLDPNEAVRILDLCDRVVGERSRRGHRFPWLLASAAPEADPARVDAWYEHAGLAVDVRGLHPEPELWRRGAILQAYEVEYAVVEGPEEEDVRAQLADPDNRGFSVIVGANVAWQDLEEGEGWEEDEEGWEEDDEGWEEDDDEEFEPPWWPVESGLSDVLDEVGPRDSGAAQVLGWRGRSIALALLGALALSRRALKADADALMPYDAGLDVLLALAAAEAREAMGPGLAEEELASALAVERGYVAASLRRLDQRGHVERRGHPEDGPDAEVWTLTTAGLERVGAWLVRASPLFRDWPADLEL